jgi:hypothetical protein
MSERSDSTTPGPGPERQPASSWHRALVYVGLANEDPVADTPPAPWWMMPVQHAPLLVGLVIAGQLDLDDDLRMFVTAMVAWALIWAIVIDACMRRWLPELVALRRPLWRTPISYVEIAWAVLFLWLMSEHPRDESWLFVVAIGGVSALIFGTAKLRGVSANRRRPDPER